MASFAIRNPYFIIVLCLICALVGTVSVVRMPVDLFPPIKIPVVVVATFYTGMPPEQIETNITSRFERFFTLASSVEHVESRSLAGVSLIKIYFQPGTSADAATSNISNLAMANLRRLPPGTLPPIVLKFDSSSLPVCLIALRSAGDVTETQLRDIGQFNIRNQLANIPGASLPTPFGGKYRQIMIYVDPLKLEAHQLSPMDVVRSVNEANLILPAGEVQVGPLNYPIYTNAQVADMSEIDAIPLRSGRDQATLTVGDVGKAKDAQQIQVNVVRVDGQRSVYLPVMKQGGDSNTISVVDNTRAALPKLTDVPDGITSTVVFDQSVFVRKAIENLIHEGGIGLFLTSMMILVFLGNFRATVAVMLSIPLSALATFLVLGLTGSTVNTMILGGLALAFSRLIDNSVVVLENIFRYLEMGRSPREAAEIGGNEVALPVLASTLTTAIVFFPVVFLYGVSQYLFTALALAVVISLFASYIVALTVVPLFCSRLLKAHSHEEGHATRPNLFRRFLRWFDGRFEALLRGYTVAVTKTALERPATALAVLLILCLLSYSIFPLLGVSFFPRTDPSQFVISIKAPAGTNLEVTERETERIESIIRTEVPPAELELLVANLGNVPGFSSIFSPNAGQNTGFLQVSLKEGHKTSSFEYMKRVRARVTQELPHVATYFQTGGLVDSIINMGLPAPIDVQVSGSNLRLDYEIASRLAAQIREIPGVSGAFIPQDIEAPGLRLDFDRQKMSQLGLTQREVLQNVITALSSSQMIAPSYWTDLRSGLDYLLTVQYAEGRIKSLYDLRSIPLHGNKYTDAARLDAITTMTKVERPAEVARYQLRRVVDIYVNLENEDLGRVAAAIEAIIAKEKLPGNVRVDLRGVVEGMRQSFISFGGGLVLAVALLFLILVAQFRSFLDPVIILLAVPPGLSGVLFLLYSANTTLNVMSLMGVVMMVGIVVSNSILLVDFAHKLRSEGLDAREAISSAARTRLRPILMTSLATIIGLMPMAAKLGAGGESYAPLAQAIIGGLSVSLVVTMFIVPAAYLLAYREKPEVKA